MQEKNLYIEKIYRDIHITKHKKISTANASGTSTNIDMVKMAYCAIIVLLTFKNDYFGASYNNLHIYFQTSG